jgi:hypothetical protein
MNLTQIDSAEDRVVYQVSNGSKEELNQRLNTFFNSQGYGLKSSEGETLVYEKGSRTARILLGAFVKYHKQSVTIKTDRDQMQLMLHRDSTGMSGGLIGMSQVKKEFHRLTQAFKSSLPG